MHEMNRRRFLKTSISAGISCWVPVSCGSNRVDEFHWQSIAFDTKISIYALGVNFENHKPLAQMLSKRVFELERQFSLYLPESALSQLNLHGEIHQANKEFIDLLGRALGYAEQTKGLFDVTVQPLWEWYSEGKPEAKPIDEILALVDYQNVVISGNNVSYLKEGMKITLNGLVQGYLTDEIGRLLASEGVKHALINGGEYLAMGDNLGEPWTVDVAGRSKILDTLHLDGGEALAVSASYAQVFSRTESHLFHPQNGTAQPIDRTIAVKASSAELADVLATALSVAPQSQWALLAEPAQNTRVYEAGKILYQTASSSVSGV